MRLSLLIEITSFFFEPGELGGEATYLSVQFMHLFGVSLFPGRLLLSALAGKDGGQRLKGLISPLVELVWVDAVFSGYLGDALLFAQYLPHDVGLVFW